MEKKGRYGEFGGQYAAETLMNALINLMRHLTSTKMTRILTVSLIIITSNIRADRQFCIMPKK